MEVVGGVNMGSPLGYNIDLLRKKTMPQRSDALIMVEDRFYLLLRVTGPMRDISVECMRQIDKLLCLNNVKNLQQ